MVEIIFDKNQNKSIAYDDKVKIGECVFVETDNNWNIVHTEVNALYQGQGIARKLVENVMEKAKDYGKNIIAECSYAKKIIDKRK